MPSSAMRSATCAADGSEGAGSQIGPILCAIPVEVRLMIFEFAVKIDKPVVPRQITEHSNKFTWGERKQVPVYDHPGNDDYVWECQEDGVLAVVSLSLTCKQFYEELRDYPIFYRINRFSFAVEDLVPYLAAITPERRHMVQDITLLALSEHKQPWAAETRKSRHTVALLKHAFTLLSWCRSLRDPSAVQAALSRMQPANQAAISCGGDLGPSALQQAIDFAALDISGPVRAFGYRPVSPVTHTRFQVLKQKRQDSIMDYRLGTLKKDVLPRYDSRGRLMWRVREILSIRRGSRGPKCQVEWWNTGSKDATEWEDAGSLMTQEGLELFRKFYDDSAERFRTLAMSGGPKCELDAALTRHLTVPTPDEVKALGVDMFKKRALQSRWRRLQKDYERTEYMLRAYSALAAEREQKDTQKKRPAAQGLERESKLVKRMKARHLKVT